MTTARLLNQGFSGQAWDGVATYTDADILSLWNRRPSCAQFLQAALVERGSPVTLEEVQWWINRFGLGPNDNYTFESWKNTFFLFKNSFTYIFRSPAIKGITDLNNRALEDTRQKYFEIYQRSKPTDNDWPERRASGANLYVLNFSERKKFDSCIQKAIRDDNMLDCFGTAYLNSVTDRIRSLQYSLDDSVCADEFIEKALDYGELEFSAYRPYCPPEKFGEMGLTENPMGLPISIMKWFDKYSLDWPGYFQQRLYAHAPDNLSAVTGANAAFNIEEDKRITLTYAKAFIDTAAFYAPNDLALQTVAQNFLRMAKNIAAVNKKLSEAQDKAFTGKIVGMIAGAAMGWGIGQIFGPYISTMSNAVGQVAGTTAKFVTSQVLNTALKQISSAVLGAINSPPDFDPPTILSMLPMPEAATTSAQIAQTRELSQAAFDASKDALAQAMANTSTAAGAINAALAKAKQAMALLAESRDEPSYILLVQTKQKLDQASAALRNVPYTAPILPNNPPQYLADNDIDENNEVFYSDVPDAPLPGPPVLQAGAGVPGSKSGMIIGLIALGFALAVPKRGK